MFGVSIGDTLVSCLVVKLGTRVLYNVFVSNGCKICTIRCVYEHQLFSEPFLLLPYINVYKLIAKQQMNLKVAEWSTN